MNKDQLFYNFTQLLNEYSYSMTDAEAFLLLNEYQSTRVHNIHSTNTERSRVAMARTAMYELGDSMKRFKRNKSKPQLFRLINMFCLTVTTYDQHERWSGEEKEVWDIILANKDKLLSNSKWYSDVIPEANWINTYLKDN